MNRLLSTLCLVASVAAAPTGDRSAVPMSIVATALATPELSTLVAALEAASLVGTLNGTTTYTVFAPTDVAFDQLPNGTLARLLDPKNLKALQSILLYHVLSGAVPSIDLGPRQELATVDGASVLVVKNTTGTYPNPIVTHVYVNQAEVMTADILCTNGYVHIIDQVLLPPGLELV
jgi:uncharacterized surface protein with fasciclin (FAS1) repeats